MLGIKEFGVESDAKVTNMGAPWNDCVLEMDGGRGDSRYISLLQFLFFFLIFVMNLL